MRDGLRVGLEEGGQLRIVEHATHFDEAVFDLEERSLFVGVALHAGEPPAAELVEVNDAVTVQVKIDESLLDLSLIEFNTELLHELSKLIAIDGTAAIIVESIERFLDSRHLHLLVLLLKVDQQLDEAFDGLLSLVRG